LDPLTIFGFVPARAKDRKDWLQRAQAVNHTFTFFEAPHRIRQTLTEASDIFGNRPIFVGREITKIHQEFLRGPTAEIIGQLTEPRGEFTVVVGPGESTGTTNTRVNDDDICQEFGRSTNKQGSTRRQIVIDLAKKYGRSPREVYGIIERLKNSGV
jgi:16S rRNA (cytidine1402-2'-O)-methyltransferase